MNTLPTKDQILQWISENPAHVAKRDIAKAFGIKGAARIDLKRMLKELTADGHIAAEKRKFAEPGRLPPVSVVVVLTPDSAGDLWAAPLEWDGAADQIPRILIIPTRGDAALGAGERILARLTRVSSDDFDYEARLIRRIGDNPVRILGVFRQTAEGGRVLPIDKGSDKEWQVPAAGVNGARDGELVEAEQTGPRARMGLPLARIVTRLGDPGAPKAVSLIAIHQHGIPDHFKDDTVAEADAAKPAGLKGREDLRELDLITIDPSDARDHDDAVYAHADTDKGNAGGYVIWVAIADVAHYVTPGSALDRDARLRGNSTYFPDRVVPMLPDRLSGDLCSLHEDVPRPVIAVRMTLNELGDKIAHRFCRGLMISKASLSYEQAQAARDGAPDDQCAPLMDRVINPLFEAYALLQQARERRQPLELDLPERKIVLTEEGQVSSVDFRERFDAHKLIEEMMILANVAAAEELVKRRQPLMFRVHEEPPVDKLDALREVAVSAGMQLAKGQVLMTRHLNRLLEQAKDTDHDELINMATLRSMMQAYYGVQNFGHFGLALQNYTHFTSPIRRYADLVVHRALISAHGWGKDGLSVVDIEEMESTANHISSTERRSMVAERDTNDRYLAAYLSERVGAHMTARVSGVQKFGLFVRLDETGADGLVPIRAIGNEFFHFEPKTQTLMGSQTGLEIGIGARVVVRLTEAVPVTGGLAFDLLEINGQEVVGGDGRPPRRGRPGGKGKGGFGKSQRPKQAREKVKSAKLSRKVERKRRG